MRPPLPLPTQQQCIECRRVKPCSTETAQSGFTLIKRTSPKGVTWLRYCSYCKQCECFRSHCRYYAHPDYEVARRLRYREQNLAAERARLRRNNHKKRTDLVLGTVCALYEITPDQLTRKVRNPLLVEARSIALYAFCVLGRMGVTEAGRVIGMNHSTVLHNLERLKTRPSAEEIWGMREIRRLLGEKRKVCRADERAPTYPRALPMPTKIPQRSYPHSIHTSLHTPDRQRSTAGAVG